MHTPEQIHSKFSDLHFGDGTGIGTWLSKEGMHVVVGERLRRIEEDPISKVQLNQLFVLSEIPSVSDGFFRYYWLTKPNHTYILDFTTEKCPIENGKELSGIKSLDHLRWGIYRIFVDSLLYFGSIKAGIWSLRSRSFEELGAFFEEKCFDTDAIRNRGPSMTLKSIAKDDRYLISEMACKSYGKLPDNHTELRKALVGAWEHHQEKRGGLVRVRDLLDGSFVREKYPEAQMQLSFSASDILDVQVSSTDQLLKHYSEIEVRFEIARQAALHNTELYLSVVNDLDVYVATSMRTREDFRQMADACEKIFRDKTLEGAHLRFFDPTMSAAEGHEDKGLIECLMVKCAKVLVYCAGVKESYGKDAEAAMALSLGKPVIFYCDAGQRASFYKTVHPLSRLIDFRSGVAVGAIVTDDIQDVIVLLRRIFRNEMQYRLERHPERVGFLRLCEELTGSIVRVQTDNSLLTKTFWNNYHRRDRATYVSLAAGKEAERLQE